LEIYNNDPLTASAKPKGGKPKGTKDKYLVKDMSDVLAEEVTGTGKKASNNRDEEVDGTLN
jgi:hypothetical protein